MRIDLDTWFAWKVARTVYTNESMNDPTTAPDLARAWTAAYVFFTAYALFSIDIDALAGDKNFGRRQMRSERALKGC